MQSNQSSVTGAGTALRGPQTPVPWSVRISPEPLHATVISAPAGTVAVCYATYDADAAFLIRAVNSHGDLLAICQALLLMGEVYANQSAVGDGLNNCDILAKARLIIAKAIHE